MKEPMLSSVVDIEMKPHYLTLAGAAIYKVVTGGREGWKGAKWLGGGVRGDRGRVADCRGTVLAQPQVSHILAPMADQDKKEIKTVFSFLGREDVQQGGFLVLHYTK